MVGFNKYYSFLLSCYDIDALNVASDKEWERWITLSLLWNINNTAEQQKSSQFCSTRNTFIFLPYHKVIVLLIIVRNIALKMQHIRGNSVDTE